jgi:hypothetical protein
MKTNNLNLRFGVICAMILAAALSRLIPHPASFAPIGGMALFGAAYFSRRVWAFIIPVASMWLSDLVLTNALYGTASGRFEWFYAGSLFTYAALALIVVLGMFSLRKVSVGRLIGSALGASAIFFLVSNFGAWLSMPIYAKDFGGLMSCYAAGLPFLRGTVLGDLVYTGVLFGAFEYFVKRFPRLAGVNA